MSEDLSDVIKLNMSNNGYVEIEYMKLFIEKHSFDDGLTDILEIFNITVGITKILPKFIKFQVFKNSNIDKEIINCWSGKTEWIKQFKNKLENEKSETYIKLDEIVINKDNLKENFNLLKDNIFKKVKELRQILDEQDHDYIYNENFIAEVYEINEISLINDKIILNVSFCESDIEDISKETRKELELDLYEISEIFYCSKLSYNPLLYCSYSL